MIFWTSPPQTAESAPETSWRPCRGDRVFVPERGKSGVVKARVGLFVHLVFDDMPELGEFSFPVWEVESLDKAPKKDVSSLVWISGLLLALVALYVYSEFVTRS